MICSKEIMKNITLIGCLQFEILDLGPGGKSGTAFDDCLELESKILAQFGLPETHDYQKLLFFKEYPSSDEILEIIVKLKAAANEFLLQKPLSNIEFLKLAKLENKDVFNVLPMLELSTHEYPIFVYDELFLTDKVTVENVLLEFEKCKVDGILALISLSIEYPQEMKDEYILKIEQVSFSYIEEFKNWKIENPDIEFEEDFYSENIELLLLNIFKFKLEIHKNMTALSDGVYSKFKIDKIHIVEKELLDLTNLDEFEDKNLEILFKLYKTLNETENSLQSL